MNTSNHRNSRSDNEAITSETMENKDPAINQHQNNYQDREPYNNDNSEDQNLDDNDDINLQKNSNRTIDAERDLSDKNDPDRRTLDEYSANKAEPEDEEDDEV